MTRQIRAELTALRTLRGTWGVIALVVLGGVGITLGDFSETGAHHLDTLEDMRSTLSRDAGLVGAIVMALFAAGRVAGEYRYGTIAQRVLAAPLRRRLIAARLAVYGTMAAVLGAITAAAAIPAAKAMATSKDTAFALGTSDALRVVGEVAAGSALFVMLGVAVAFITRSQPAAMLTIFGTLIVEQIVMGLSTSVGQYLPFQLLNATFETGSLRPEVAVAALAGATAAVVAGATGLLARRDVS